MRIEKRLMSLLLAILYVATLALSGCQGGACSASTNEELSALSRYCYDISIIGTEMETLEGIESYSPNNGGVSVVVQGNPRLTDVNMIPSVVTSRSFRRNEVLSVVDMGEVSGHVVFDQNESLQSLHYQLGQKLFDDFDRGPVKNDTLALYGPSPFSELQISCAKDACEMEGFYFGSFGDRVASVDEITGENIPAKQGPDMDGLIIDIDGNITIKSLSFHSIQHLTTLQSLYGIHVSEEVLVFGLPDLAEGEVEAYHQHLLDNGFTGEFTACSIPGYPECDF